MSGAAPQPQTILWHFMCNLSFMRLHASFSAFNSLEMGDSYIPLLASRSDVPRCPELRSRLT